MENIKSIIALFVTLFICVFDGYSMMSYRVEAKRSYMYFAAVSVFCLLVNSYIAVVYGNIVLRSIMIFTIGLPYLILIMLTTKDSVSQTVFNFWLWMNVYGTIATATAFINDYTFRNNDLLIIIRFIFLCGYYVLYNKYIKAKHRRIMENLKVNWWVFSFIPVFFTALIILVNFYFRDFHGYTRNYPVLFTIHALMVTVYVLIFYTFKTVSISMEKQQLAQSMKEQISLQKKQYEFQMQKAESERIFRHDARHRDTVLLGFLQNNDTDGAKQFINKKMAEVKENTPKRMCENALVNAILIEYHTKALAKGLDFSADIQMPNTLFCDEAEFCVMLSNLLENSLEAAKSYIKISIKHLNSQLSLNIKNDYKGKLRKDSDGRFATTKQDGSGLGLKSVEAILKNNGGFLKINDENGIFDVFATLKN